MLHSMKWLTCIMLVGTLSACGSEDEEEEELPEVDCTATTIPTFDQVTAFSQVCTNCHSSTLTGDARNDAPEDINFDDYASAQAHAEKAAEEVFEGAMPPATANEMLTADQEQDLYLWALCGTPE